MKRVLLLLISILSVNTLAYTECSRSPNKVWLNLTGNSVWICFDTGNCVYKTVSGNFTEAHLDRMYATGMAAISAGKNLIIRYPEDNANCSDLTSTPSRDDIQGLWFTK
ncbi:hypothetical protein [Gynuella sunshinyii]|nr:hypothetical protein [Gynuella sunshinyii]